MRSALVSIALLGAAAPSLADTPKAPKLATATTAIYPSKSCKEKGKAGEGQDPVLICPGLGDFEVTMFFSAENTYISIAKGDVTVQVGGMKIAKLEWRLADGKPIAVIADVTVKDQDTKKQSRVFMVRGLGSSLSSDVATHDKALALADAK